MGHITIGDFAKILVGVNTDVADSLHPEGLFTFTAKSRATTCLRAFQGCPSPQPWKQ